MTFKRAERVADLIREEINRILVRDIGDPRVRNVTITGVRVTDDLRIAKIYFVPLGQDSVTDDVRKGLEKATPYFRRNLGRQLRLRFVPEIHFYFDEVFARGQRMEKLFMEIRKESGDDREENP
ncbi:MAG TPA: 30S ribosome-binding factor RbfA [Syntrophales bacterium]|nr:30S ribosome-binding factor RbfA [Syntrophales bacterium]